MGVYLRTEAQVITTPWIYHNASLWLISLSSDWSTRYTIADKNLGATQVYNSWDTLSEANCGKYYQWGNNYWFPYTWSITTSSTKVNAWTYWPWNYYSSGIFILWQYRDSSQSANLWWWTTWTVGAMQWPCSSWFHIPKNTEWATLVQTWITLGSRTSSWWTAFSQYMKLPLSWYRNWASSGQTSSQWSNWRYTTSIQYDYRYSYYITFSSSSISTNIWEYKTMWFSIRPFKNEAVQPDTSWTKLN